MLSKISPENLPDLFEKLQNEAVDVTLPFRGLLWNVLNKSVKNAQVFADSWPEFRNLACLFDSQEFDCVWGDLIVVYIQEETKLTQFLTEIAQERNWTNGKGVMFMGLDSCLEETVIEFFGKQDKIEKYGPFLVFVDRNKPDTLQPIKATLYPTMPPLPAGLSMSLLTATEAAEVSKFWHYDNYPDKAKYFAWMADKFPQACLRNSQGKPVVWALEYEIGGNAARFTLPEYRRAHLGQFVHLEKYLAHYAFSPVSMYGTIGPDNQPSLAAVRQVPGYTESQFRFSWIIRKPTNAKI